MPLPAGGHLCPRRAYSTPHALTNGESSVNVAGENNEDRTLAEPVCRRRTVRFHLFFAERSRSPFEMAA